MSRLDDGRPQWLLDGDYVVEEAPPGKPFGGAQIYHQISPTFIVLGGTVPELGDAVGVEVQVPLPVLFWREHRQWIDLTLRQC